MSLTIEKTIRDEQTATIAAAGEVDVSCASDLREALDEVLDGGTQSVTVDLSQVPYIDSTGIGVLVGAAQRATEAGTKLRVAHPQRNVRRVLDLLGVTQELGIGEQDA